MRIGAFENFKLTFGSFGQQCTTIDGRKHIPYFDLADPKLRGLGPGAGGEFEARPGPTLLGHNPHVSEQLPSADVVAVPVPVRPCDGGAT
jgi:hypothetical protein